MIELFLGKPSIFWAGVEAIGVLANALILAVTGWLIYKQVRTAARVFQFDGIRKMQDLVDDFRGDREKIFATFPIELVVSSEQFATRPPGRMVARKISEGERRRMLLTREQAQALRSLNDEQMSIARKVIGRVNDLGQLVEDGFISYQVFFGKYHTMIIRLCHFLEPIRRKIEDEQHGGSYGQRLLRMRHVAITYNKICPKHRNVDIKIFTPNGSRTIVSAIEGSWSQKLLWFFQRCLYKLRFL